MMIVLVTDIGEWVSARIRFLKIPTAFLGSRGNSLLMFAAFGLWIRVKYGQEKNIVVIRIF